MAQVGHDDSKVTLEIYAGVRKRRERDDRAELRRRAARARARHDGLRRGRSPRTLTPPGDCSRPNASV
jgi:hypothetical protein